MALQEALDAIDKADLHARITAVNAWVDSQIEATRVGSSGAKPLPGPASSGAPSPGSSPSRRRGRDRRRKSSNHAKSGSAVAGPGASSPNGTAPAVLPFRHGSAANDWKLDDLDESEGAHSTGAPAVEATVTPPQGHSTATRSRHRDGTLLDSSTTATASADFTTVDTVLDGSPTGIAKPPQTRPPHTFISSDKPLQDYLEAEGEGPGGADGENDSLESSLASTASSAVTQVPTLSGPLPALVLRRGKWEARLYVSATKVPTQTPS